MMAIITTIIFMVIGIGSVLTLFLVNAYDINYLSLPPEEIEKHRQAKRNGTKIAH